MKEALIVVDVQNDFVTGSLAVNKAAEIFPTVNKLMEEHALVVATQDWHPNNHGSFAANHIGHVEGDVISLDGLSQVLWPVHCVQGTYGAKFVESIDETKFQKVFAKGTDPQIDSYSGFFDNGHRKATGLGEYLKSLGVEKVYIVGLAADYCVKFTALDAVGLGFETYLVKEGTRGVNLQEGDTERAFKEMEEKGVKLI